MSFMGAPRSRRWTSPVARVASPVTHLATAWPRIAIHQTARVGETIASPMEYTQLASAIN